MPSDPHLELVAFIAALGCAVEDPIVAHQELHPAARRRVRVVDGVVVEYKRVEPESLADVFDEVRARRAGVMRGDRRERHLQCHSLARLLLRAREAELVIELRGCGRDPGKTPSHAALVGLQLLKRCL